MILEGSTEIFQNFLITQLKIKNLFYIKLIKKS